MTKFSILLGLIFAFSTSCNNGSTNKTEIPKQETPKVLQDKLLDTQSYIRSGDLTEELYQELVEKTPALKNLEDELDDYRSKPSKINTTFVSYDNKSNYYYASAKFNAAEITDSILKTKILDLIARSSKTYSNKKSEYVALLDEISKNKFSLNDQHSVLKIVLSLPLIEKYQDNNKPNKSEFQNLINEQNHLIFKIDSLTPKY